MEASKSTDKLIILGSLIEELPLKKIKSFKLIWDVICDVVVPIVSVEFYEEE